MMRKKKAKIVVVMMTRTRLNNSFLAAFLFVGDQALEIDNLQSAKLLKISQRERVIFWWFY